MAVPHPTTLLLFVEAAKCSTPSQSFLNNQDTFGALLPSSARLPSAPVLILGSCSAWVVCWDLLFVVLGLLYWLVTNGAIWPNQRLKYLTNECLVEAACSCPGNQEGLRYPLSQLPVCLYWWAVSFDRRRKRLNLPHPSLPSIGKGNGQWLER